MTDEAIMEAVKNGDLQQLAVLFDRYQKPIFNFLARMVNDHDQAEDLTQNVFLRIMKYRASYRTGLRFQSWIYQVARNVFSDHYQKIKSKGASMDIDRVADDVVDDNDAHDQEDRERLLRESMNRLSDEQREVLVLTRFQHLKYEEVAVMMNTTETNIKVKVHRAIGKLREYYFELQNK